MATTTRRGVLVDTFAGFGGLSLGMEQAGFDVQVGVDVEPVNASTHEMGLENDPEDLSYRRIWRRDRLTCSQRTQHEGASVERFMATAPGRSERISRRHRLDPNGQALTLRAGSNAEHGSFTAVVPIHSKGSRVITVREGCRLHSVPDWVRLCDSKIAALRQLGNSVPPLLGRAVGRQVMKALDLAPAAPVEAIELGDETLLSNTSIRSIAKAA